MEKEDIRSIKGFKVTSIRTGKTLYEGNVLVKTIEALFSTDTDITFAHPVNRLLLNQAIAMQERLN